RLHGEPPAEHRIEHRRVARLGGQEDDEVLARDHPVEALLAPSERLEQLDVALRLRGGLEAEIRGQDVAARREPGERAVVATVEEGEAGVDLGAVGRLVDARGARRGTRADLAGETRREIGRGMEAPGAGAQLEEAPKDGQRALRGREAREGAEVRRVVGSEPLGGPEAREAGAHAELQEPDAREAAALAVVGRLQLTDLARFEE